MISSFALLRTRLHNLLYLNTNSVLLFLMPLTRLHHSLHHSYFSFDVSSLAYKPPVVTSGSSPSIPPTLASQAYRSHAIALSSSPNAHKHKLRPRSFHHPTLPHWQCATQHKPCDLHCSFFHSILQQIGPRPTPTIPVNAFTPISVLRSVT